MCVELVHCMTIVNLSRIVQSINVGVVFSRCALNI